MKKILAKIYIVAVLSLLSVLWIISVLSPSIIFFILFTTSEYSVGLVIGIVCSLIGFTIYIILILRLVRMILRNIIYDSEKVRFSYILTLYVQENTATLFAWLFPIAFILVGDMLNPFEGWIYYACNILTFLLGLGFGGIQNVALIESMRKRTMWKGDWEKYQKNINDSYLE